MNSALRVRRLGWFGLSVLTLALAGCAVIKRDRYDVPVVPLPAQYKNAPVAVPNSPDSKDTPAKFETQLDPVLVEWWHSFGSTELDDLINRGLANNPDVRILTFKIAQAKVRADQSIAGKGPTITAPMQTSEQYPYYGVAGPVTIGLDPVNGPNGEKVKQLFQASIRGDWRADLWGELDSLAQSANLQLWRASFERDNMQGNVAASIVSSYVEYLSLNDRIRIARETETVLSGMVSSVEGRVEIGDATAIDLEQQKTAVYQVRATIPALDQQREDALGTIAFLLGTVPESLKLSENGLDSLSLPSVIPGMPSALLLRRPDVRMMEARLLAADADIDVARARILPPLDLTAQVGYGSSYLSELFKPQAMFWNAMANLSITIFDGGKLSREKDYAQAVHEEMVETYVRTIYQAVREVESSLNAIRQTGSRLEAQKESADAAHRAWDYSSEVYAVGMIDNSTLLDTERTYHRNLDEYYRIRMDRYRALANLFHALGGGVPQGETIPGKGARPVMISGSKDGVISAAPNNMLAPVTLTGSKDGVIFAAPDNTLALEGADWVGDQFYEKEDAWLVELPGLYHRKTMDAALLDLQTRFPSLMKNRFLRRHREGRMEDSADKKLSWYRVYIAKFQTAAAAEEVCAALRADYRRCRVVLSQKGDIVEPASASLRMDSTLTVSPQEEARTVPTSGFDPAKAFPVGLSAESEIIVAQIPASEPADITGKEFNKIPSSDSPHLAIPAAKAVSVQAEEEKARQEAQAKEEARAEAARVKAEKKAKIEADAHAAAEAKAAKLKAKREAKAEAVRLKAERKDRAKAEKQAAEEARKTAKAEASRVKAEQKTRAEAARVKAEQEAQAVEDEEARLEAQAKAAKIAAKEKARAEAARVKAEKKAKIEADAHAAAEAKATKLKAKREAKRLDAEQQDRAEEARKTAKAEASRIKAEQKTWVALEVEAAQMKAEQEAQAAAEAEEAHLKAEHRTKAEKQTVIDVPYSAAPSAEVFSRETEASGGGLASTESGQEEVGVRQVYVVQLDIYRHESKAAREASLWQKKGYDVYVRQYRRGDGSIGFKTLAGVFSRREDAGVLAASIRNKEGVQAFVVLVATGEDGKPEKIIDVHRLTRGK